MTEKQKKIIEQMKAENALCANVMYSYKNCPEEVLDGTIKLKLYDENDPIDELNDECYFFYFEDIDEMVKAMDASNNDFDFTILSIHSFIAVGNPTDRNGFTIQRGDHAFVFQEDIPICDGVVIGDPSEKEVIIDLDDEIEHYVKPSDVEINYDEIKINVSDIVWDTEDGFEEELVLPKEETITLSILVDGYGLEDFESVLGVQEAVNDYLSDKYNFCVVSYCFEYDHKRK